MPGQQGTFLFNPNDFKGIKKSLVALRVLRKLRSLSWFLRSSFLLMAAPLSFLAASLSFLQSAAKKSNRCRERLAC